MNALAAPEIVAPSSRHDRCSWEHVSATPEIAGSNIRGSHSSHRRSPKCIRKSDGTDTLTRHRIGGPVGRTVPSRIRILALIASLALLPACQERKRLEKEAPALSRADLHVDRIAIVGVVSDVAAIGESTENSERWC